MLNKRLEALKYKTDKTLQDLFDIAWERAKIQVKSEIGVDPYNACRYRGPGGGCFIGCAFPDDWYKPEIEGEPAYTIRSVIGVAADVHDLDLTELQRIHDDYSPDVWQDHLIFYATSERNLKIPDEVTADVR